MEMKKSFFPSFSMSLSFLLEIYHANQVKNISQADKRCQEWTGISCFMNIHHHRMIDLLRDQQHGFEAQKGNISGVHKKQTPIALLLKDAFAEE